MKDPTLGPHHTLYDAVGAIESTFKRLAVVVSDDNVLLGTLTDGDIRRCLLSGGTLDTQVSAAMNTSPLVVLPNTSEAYIVEQLQKKVLRAVPVVDDKGRFLNILHINDLMCRHTIADHQSTFDAAVIMAGGEGMRLRPLTDDTPKPMLEIGGIPLLERQVYKLANSGVKQVYISVNYLSEVIEAHFGDGAGFDVKIDYLRENKKMGTAGALSLLPASISGTLLVMNGDVLSNYDLTHLFDFHLENFGEVTICAVDYRVEIPFGVIDAVGAEVVGLEEKPSQRYLCNAGIYAISHAVLRNIPIDTYFNMTDLIQRCLDNRQRVCVFPVHEFWTDIGTPEELERARNDFTELAIRTGDRR